MTDNEGFPSDFTPEDVIGGGDADEAIKRDIDEAARSDDDLHRNIIESQLVVRAGCFGVLKELVVCPEVENHAFELINRLEDRDPDENPYSADLASEALDISLEKTEATDVDELMYLDELSALAVITNAVAIANSMRLTGIGDAKKSKEFAESQILESGFSGDTKEALRKTLH